MIGGKLLGDRNEVSTGVDPHTGQSIVEDLIWRGRCSFFRDALNIDKLSVLMGLAEEMNLLVTRLEGSPSFILNEGRQKLFGNVGYRIIEDNAAELLEHQGDQASWC